MRLAESELFLLTIVTYELIPYGSERLGFTARKTGGSSLCGPLTRTICAAPARE